MVLRFLKDLERLAYGLLIMREPDSKRIARFGEVTKEIERSEDIFEEMSRLQLTVAEKAKIINVLDGPFYTELRSAVSRKSVLLRLDSLLASGEAKYEYPEISVEHVLPQKPQAGSEWLQWFPKQSQRDHWTHRIANLVLLSKRANSSANNYEFARKKTSYFVRTGVTTFALTVPVLECSSWTPELLEKRQIVLLNELRRHWRLS